MFMFMDKDYTEETANGKMHAVLKFGKSPLFLLRLRHSRCLEINMRKEFDFKIRNIFCKLSSTGYCHKE